MPTPGFNRPSAHLLEWAVGNPVQADPAEAPTDLILRYTNELPGKGPGPNLKAFRGEDGAVYFPPLRFDYLPAASMSPDTETVIESTSTIGDYEYRNRVTSSNRMLMPTRWEFRVRQISTGTVIFDKPILLIGDGSGAKYGMGMRETLIERHDDAATKLIHQLNLGGHGHIGHEADPGVDVQSYGSRPIKYETSDDAPYHHVVARPMDLGGVVTPGDEYDHGEQIQQDDTHPVLWPWHRFVQNLDMEFNASVATAHKVTEHWYAPREWNNDGVSNPLFCQLEALNSLVGHTFDEAYLHNLSTGASVAIAGFGTLTANEQEWRVSKLRYEHEELAVINDLGMPPVHNGPVAITLRDTATDMAVTFALVLSNTDDDADNFTQRELGAPNFIRIRQHSSAGTADPTSTVSTRVDFVSKSYGKRPQGWISFQYFVITARFADITGVLTALALSNVLGDDPDEPPVEATTGDGGAAYPVPVVETPVVLDTGKETLLYDHYSLLRAVIPDPAYAPTGAVEVKSGSVVTDPLRQRAITSPRAIVWPPAPTGDSELYHAENLDTITKVVVKGNKRYTNTITYGDRTLIVLHWRTLIEQVNPPAVLHDYDWMADGLPPSTGSAFQIASFIWENPGDPALIFLSNPNSGGQGPDNTYVTVDPSWRSLCGAPLHLLVDKTAGELQTGVYPVDFIGNYLAAGVDGLPGTAEVSDLQDHGIGLDGVTLYYGMRQFQNWRLNWQGSPFLHRYDAWEFYPFEVNDNTRPFRGRLVATVSLVNPKTIAWDEIYIRDVATGVQRKITPYTDTGTIDGADRYFSKNSTLDSIVGLGTVSAPDVPSGYACGVFRNSATDFCIACIVKLGECSYSISQQYAAQIEYPTQLQLKTNDIADSPWFGYGPHIINYTGFFVNSFSNQKRPKGWVGMCLWVYAGPFADLAATLNEAYAAGVFDADPRADLPHNVITGTTFTGVSGEEGPIVEDMR